MHNAFSIAVASVLLATSALATTAAADSRHSRFQQQDRVVQNYCNSNRGDDSCRDWSRNRNNWDESHYQGWYGDHHRDDNRADDSIARLFGFAAGVIAGTVANGSGGHVSSCEGRYRSYDRGSDTYLGFDGLRHDCVL